MTEFPCRDCGTMLNGSERGCPVCALNFEAERMIDRFIWLKLVPSILVLAIAVVVVIIYFGRR
ncbi:MAG: hypothetical protein ACREA9_19510 [Pyrinomonadaceae bacterium]